MKEFNTTGLCNPNKHYMVDISEKLDYIKTLIKKEKYFIINRPRQFGKTTILYSLQRELSDEYLVLNISFEGIGDRAFIDEERFVNEFIDIIKESLEYIDEELIEKLTILSKDIESFLDLSKVISKFIKSVNKEVILIIDEVDKSTNNQLFLNFLGMLRNKYLQREAGKGLTFKSVILSGVYDVKNLKLKLRPDEERKYNSPWNIAVPFNIDMSLSQKGIEEMLNEYKKDRNIELDTKKVSEFIYYYTNGYPFFVSRICQIIDEDLNATWNEETLLKSIKMLLSESNTLFDDLIKNIENYKELKEYMFNLIMNGIDLSFNIDISTINLGHIFGYFRNENGKVKISNRIFEQRLYNYFSYEVESIASLSGYNIKSNFIKGNGLDIEKILLSFQQFMKEQYSKRDEKFLERHGRLLFLAFIKPIINGVGFDFKEPQTSEEKRLDVVIVYNNHKYIIELKIWRGDSYYQKGLKQLADYLEYNKQDKGYLLVFDFNEGKQYKREDLVIEGKKIVAVFT